ncbi:hypothetical protein MJO28_011343 [Puccinia striiformis f. sp. tritici]|uniref:Uncharacterized protein n=1 Tax=Puccinia striiformis f. sp. tritici TaxID=168172 RepID=A0ACC0E1W0_9BASI|nr:hypothetical protein MJO28_011343 [Puccinia striiformis f. sp. tritici]
MSTHNPYSQFYRNATQEVGANPNAGFVLCHVEAPAGGDRRVYIRPSVDEVGFFSTSEHFPPIQRLALHLEGEHIVYYIDEDGLRKRHDSGSPRRTTLTEFFRLNKMNTISMDVPARSLLYHDFPRRKKEFPHAWTCVFCQRWRGGSVLFETDPDALQRASGSPGCLHRQRSRV